MQEEDRNGLLAATVCILMLICGCPALGAKSPRRTVISDAWRHVV